MLMILLYVYLFWRVFHLESLKKSGLENARREDGTVSDKDLKWYESRLYKILQITFNVFIGIIALLVTYGFVLQLLGAE